MCHQYLKRFLVKKYSIIKKIIKYYSLLINSLDEHTLEVFKKSSSSFFVKVIGILAGLAVSIFLGRTIGADGLGIINLSHRIINIIMVLCLFGMRQLIIKEVAIANNKKDYDHIGNVMNTSYWFNGLLSIIFAVVLILLSPFLANSIFNEPQLEYPLIIALFVLTPQIFSRIFSSGLVGYRKIWQSSLVDKTLSICVVGILLLIVKIMGWPITVLQVAFMYAIGRIIVFMTTGLYWRSIYKGFSKKFILSSLLPTAFPLFLATASNVISASVAVIMLGWLAESQDVGLYSVAARLALLTSFFHTVVNSVLSPKIAALYEQDNKKELQKMIKKVTRGLLILGISTLIAFTFFGNNILVLWGSEFKNAYYLLVILSIGQLVNLGTGAVGSLLIMTGNEKIQGRIAVIFLLLSIPLNFILIKKYGGIGAAISTALIVSLQNIIRLIFVRIKVGIKTL